MAAPLGDKESLSRGKDAIVVNEGERDAHNAASRWEALMTFHRAPCLRQSVGVGLAGGVSIGGLRYFGGSGGRAAFTWGSIVGGLLAGTSWYTCRKRMYAVLQDEVSLLQRVAEKDPEALREYQRKLEARQRR